MTNPSLTARVGRIAMLALAATLIIGILPVRAAGAVELQVRPMMGGRYEVGGWLGISVTLINHGPPTDGYLSAATDGGTVRREVEMPAGARKVVNLYVEPTAFQTAVDVSYTEPNGTTAVTAEVRVLEQTALQTAIVGDTEATLRPQLVVATAELRPEPISISVIDLPDRPEPLHGISTVVWAADASALNEAQRRSLEAWVADGGRLIVLGGPDWQARAASLLELLPVESLESVDGASLAPIAAWAGAEAPPVDEATVSTGPLRPDARAIIAAGDGSALASLRPFGSGMVVLIGADLATQDFRGWSGSPRVWARLLQTGILPAGMVGGSEREESMRSMSSALASLPSLEVPPAELLLAIIVGYILLIGPVSYLVLRRLDRRELAWITAPILIITFSACSYGIGRTIKGSDVILHQVAVIRTTPAGAALAETYAGVFSPDRAGYSLTVDADALVGAMPSDSFADPSGAGQGGVVAEQGRPARLSGLSVGAFGFSAIHASAVIDRPPALELSWKREGGTLNGTVTNVSDATLSDVAYISVAGGVRIGDLAPGQSATFELPGPNFNGTAAADQVYGFGGFEAQTPEQRRITLRREVIAALVGYGGWMDADAASVAGRGPFVIGWYEDEGPMPVLTEGVSARRYVSAVEVINARPSLGSGQVTVTPGRMATSLIATEGEFSQFEPGTISIIDGSATFSVSLPLEASGLEASEVKIIVGSDPGMVFQPSDFPGMWPAGFTAEVLDPISGAWTVLGDLSGGSTFTVDPDRSLSPGGTIMVRVSGTSDQTFGAVPIYVGAEVTGVLD